MTVRPRRSVLYVPGTNVRALEKAVALAADVILIDLEDAVAPAAKDEARAHALSAIRSGAFADKELAVRINGLETAEAVADLAVAALADAVVVPKVGTPEDIRRVRAGLAALDAAATPVWAMIETPMAILNLAAIAATAGGAGAPLACFVLGTNDLAKDLRLQVTASRYALLPCLSQAVIAARAYGLDVLDGVFNSLKDTEGFAAECRQGRGLGFDGKTLIHPAQIALANEIFAPGEVEITEARAVVEAFALPENAGKGVITVNGRMTERLHLASAERTLALAARLRT